MYPLEKRVDLVWRSRVSTMWLRGQVVRIVRIDASEPGA